MPNGISVISSKGRVVFATTALFLACLAPVSEAKAWVVHVLGNGASTSEGLRTSPGAMEASQNPRAPCGLDLEISGGTFSPDICQFEIVSGGTFCADPKACKSDYVISLKTSRPGRDEIMSVVLFNIREFKTGMYKFDPGTGATDFKGQLTDETAVARHLLRGAITLDRRGEDKVQIMCEVHFATDIVVRASGLVDVKRLNAP